jgi:4-aminobutyrate aminotransferase-like enzyme
MFGATIPERYKGNLVVELSNRKIFISQRGNSVRFSPHLHISDHDVNRLLETLEELVK